MSKDFDKTSKVSDNCKIWDNTKIWVNAQVREFVIIWEDCILWKDVYVDKNVKIWNRCKIQNWALIFDGVNIWDDVFIWPNVVFTNDKVPRSFNKDWKKYSTIVNNWVSIWANSTILCGIELWEYSMIWAWSVVTKNVKPYTLVLWNPAKFYSKIDKFWNKVIK